MRKPDQLSASVEPRFVNWFHRDAHERFWDAALVDTVLRVLLTQRDREVLVQVFVM